MFCSRLSGILFVLPLLGAGPATEPARLGRVVVLNRCEVEYVRSSQIGVAAMETNATILQDCYVRQGDRVKAGQVLGRIMDQDLRVELELRTAAAESDIEIRAQEAKYAQMISRVRRSENLLRRSRDLVSEEEYNLQKLEATSSALAIEEAKHRRHLAEIQKRQVEARLHAREFVCPHDGVVVEVLKNKGEALAVHEPVFRVVDVDHLKVTGHLNIDDYWRVKKGHRVRVVPEVEGTDLAVEREEFAGRVTFIDSRIDPATQTCKIVTEVENRGLLLVSGIEARMEILLDEPLGANPGDGPALPAPADLEPKLTFRPADAPKAATVSDGSASPPVRP